MANKHAVVGDVRGRGAMFAVEFSDPRTGRPDPATTVAVAAACHKQGLVVLTCGTDSNVLRLLPPLVIEDDLLDEGLSILERAVAAIRQTGQVVADETLTHLSPLKWEHINLTGDYHWRKDAGLRNRKSRALRTGKPGLIP